MELTPHEVNVVNAIYLIVLILFAVAIVLMGRNRGD